MNVALLEEIIRLDNVTHEKVRKRAGWGSTINLRRALDGSPLTKGIFQELAEALSVNPVCLLLAGSGATYADVLRGRGEDPPPSGSSVYRGPAELHELCALDDFGRVVELTKRFYYKIENATLTIRGTKVDLIIDVTMYGDPSCSKEKLSSHRLQGDGPFEDRIANILYRADDQERKISWTGVCVLSVPKNGKVHGYWMAAGQIARGKTVLGTLELKPTLT